MIYELQVYRFAGGGECVVRADSPERAVELRDLVMRDCLVAEGALPAPEPMRLNPPPIPIIGPAGEIHDAVVLGAACPGTRCGGRGRVHGTEVRCMECDR